MMNVRVTLILLIPSIFSQAQDLSDRLIRERNIYVITKYTTYTTKGDHGTYTYKTKTVTEYNRHGLPLKSTEVNPRSDLETDSSVSRFFYKDTLLISIEWKGYLRRKLIDYELVNYAYTIDDLNRITSRTILYQNGRQSKEVYIRGLSNLIDTILQYSNDTAIYIPERHGYDHLTGKTLQLKKIVSNTWTANGTLSSIKECPITCRYSYINIPDICCQITEFNNNQDTLAQQLKFYNEGWQARTEIKYRMPSGALYEESQRGDKSITFQLENKEGLLSRTERNEIQIEGRHHQVITTYSYKFYRK